MRLLLGFGTAALHADSHGTHSFITEWLSGLGRVGEFIDEVLLHALLDTLILLPLLFLTYLFMEFIEHKASDRLRTLMSKSGPVGTVAGAAFGALPQCGFSAAAANLYTGRVITLGTLIAVFLSTSDEMLPVMLSGEVELGKIMLIVVYKVAVGIVVGFGIDFTLRLLHRGKRDINIDEICENDNCHCERGILSSALHHTLTVSLFILAVTLGLNCLIFFIGSEELSNILPDIPVISHLIAAILGLIPNCAVSVAFTKLAVGGFISTGVMLSALFSGAGVGLLVLFRMNKHRCENIAVAVMLVILGTVFGAVGDLLPFLALS